MPFGAKLWRAFYVCTHGWPRWGAAARHKWARELRNAAAATVVEVDAWLAANPAPPEPAQAPRCGYRTGSGINRSGVAWVTRCANITWDPSGRCHQHRGRLRADLS